MKWISQSTTKKNKIAEEKGKTPTITQLDAPEQVNQVPDPIEAPPKPLEQATKIFRASHSSLKSQPNAVRLNKNWNNRLKSATQMMQVKTPSKSKKDAQVSAKSLTTQKQPSNSKVNARRSELSLTQSKSKTKNSGSVQKSTHSRKLKESTISQNQTPKANNVSKYSFNNKQSSTLQKSSVSVLSQNTQESEQRYLRFKPQNLNRKLKDITI